MLLRYRYNTQLIIAMVFKINIEMQYVRYKRFKFLQINGAQKIFFESLQTNNFFYLEGMPGIPKLMILTILGYYSV